jgi:hypothetical protein
VTGCGHNRRAIAGNSRGWELLRYGQAQKALLAGGIPELAGRHVRVAPLLMVRRAIAGIELNGYVAKHLLIFVAETALHNRLLLKLLRGAASCPLPAGLDRLNMKKAAWIISKTAFLRSCRYKPLASFGVSNGA